MAAPRKLSFTFRLGTGDFGEGGYDMLEVSDVRASVVIDKSGGVGLNRMNARIWGLRQSVMNQLSIVGNQLITGRNNRITVKAGDGETMSIVFDGNIAQAWGAYSGAPDVPFQVTGAPMLIGNLKAIPPSSFTAQSDVSTILQSLAEGMKIPFRNDGVQVKLPEGLYIAGTAPAQAAAVAQMAVINLIYDEIQGVEGMVIWPKDGVRGGPDAPVPVINKNTGMVGYPAWTQGGIMVQTLFNPEIAYGSAVLVESSIVPASQKWAVFKLVHSLDAEMPGGAWFTDLECWKFGLPAPVATGGG